MTDGLRKHFLLTTVRNTCEDVKTAGIFAETLGYSRSCSRSELKFLDLLPVVALGSGVIGYAPVLAVNDTWTFEDLGGALLLAAESTVSPSTLKLAVTIEVSLTRKFATGRRIALARVVTLASITNELRASIVLALAVMASITTSMAGAVSMSTFLPCVVLAIGVIFRRV